MLATDKIIISASVECMIFMAQDHFPTAVAAAGVLRRYDFCRCILCIRVKRSDVKGSHLSLSVSPSDFFFFFPDNLSLSLTRQI